MKNIIILFISFACSFSSKIESKKQSADSWWILENYNSSWTKEKMISLLGEPNQALPSKDETNWVYRDPDTKHQTWAIGIRKDGKTSGLAYLPVEDLYIMDVEARWKNKKCEHKKETILIAGHHYTEERSFICDNGKIKVFYNRYNEVEGIYLK